MDINEMPDTSTMIKSLEEFMDAFENKRHATPSMVDAKTAMLCVRLMLSEVTETIEAISKDDMVEILDGVVDTLYVTIWTALSYGLGDIIEPAFKLVHENNMSKLGPDGNPIKDASGKVVKPEGYKPVDLLPLLKHATTVKTRKLAEAIDKNQKFKYTDPGVCPYCRGSMVGDGYTVVRHCENMDVPDDIEPDGGPLHCNNVKKTAVIDCTKCMVLNCLERSIEGVTKCDKFKLYTQKSGTKYKKQLSTACSDGKKCAKNCIQAVRDKNTPNCHYFEEREEN